MQVFQNAFRVVTFGAFFVAEEFLAVQASVLVVLVTLMTSPQAFGSECVPSGRGEPVTVVHVYDGDTVRLDDGRRVRLLGINTPELGRNGKPNQPFAKASKQALEGLLAVKAQVYLYSDTETHDKYGRYLGHLYRESSGRRPTSIEQQLLTKGLAYHVVVPPNLVSADCFAKAEALARSYQRGLWGLDGTRAQAPGSGLVYEGGYQRITAQVSRVSFKKAWWITFNKGFTVVIYPENQGYFDQESVAAWPQKWFEVEGWVYKSSYRGKPQWRLKLETPYAISHRARP